MLCGCDCVIVHVSVYVGTVFVQCDGQYRCHPGSLKMEGKDAVQGADRLWLLHWLLLHGPTLPPGPCGLGLGQLMGFGQKKCSWKNRKQDFGVVMSLPQGRTHSILEHVLWLP